MPEPSPVPSAPGGNPVEEPRPASDSPPVDAGHMPMTEEMDSAKWRLPPILPVLAAAAVVALVVGIFSFVMGRPSGSGQILNVTGVEQVTKDSMLVAVNVAVKNVSKEPVTIKSIHVEITPAAGAPDQSVLSDEAASAVDYDRYFQAYPALAQNKIDPLRPDTKLLPGETQQGMVIVGFPVNQEAFDKRKSLRVLVTLYDHSVPVKIQQ
jgi:hypothetical protein